MPEGFVNLPGVDKVFAVCAVLGGILFMIRVVLMFLGGGGGDHGDLVAEHGDSDASFRILSFQGLTSFFMMFGLIGLALSRESKTTAAVAVAGGVAAGLGAVWATGWIFKQFIKLQSSGTLNLKNAIGSEGTIYLRIAKGQIGKVRVAIQGRLEVFDAMGEGDQEIPSDARVQVVDVVSGNVMVVKAL